MTYEKILLERSGRGSKDNFKLDFKETNGKLGWDSSGLGKGKRRAVVKSCNEI
jgi:hypothetical protein